MQECLADSWQDLTLVRFDQQKSARTVAHASNFSVEWVRGQAGQSFPFASDDETVLLFPSVGGAVSGAAHRNIPARSVAIVPAGRHTVALAQDGAFVILATHRADVPATGKRHQKTSTLERSPVAVSSEIRVFGFDEIAAPADNRRLKFLRSATMSINMAEYDGPRDRNQLSPHSHSDFEQATLTVSGSFVHHLRVGWGRDANLWRDDLHLQVEGATVVIIPPEIMHTTEGTGKSRNLLFDIFAPPRADFIAKGWIYNAAAYEPSD